jgi:ferrous iron transport protein B
MSATVSHASFKIDYGPEIEAEIDHIQRAILEKAPHLVEYHGYNPRWLAMKLLEGDQDLTKRMAATPGGGAVVETARASAGRLRGRLGDDAEILLADRRYGYINGLVRKVSQRRIQTRFDLTQAIDSVVTHRVLGLPIFLLMMYLVFKLVIDVSAPYLDWVDGVFAGPVTHWVMSIMGALGLGGSWIEALLVGGVIAGVGGVLVFLPGLLVLYFFLTVLEDTGYMARAAFVMDRLMSFLGLHGKAFIPLVLGFGCTVPAIYATRTLRSQRDRLLTAFLIPLMSCSARLPVYLLFGMAFFAAQADLLIWSMYALGIVVAVVYGFVLTRTVFRHEGASSFVLELPPYRMPMLRTLLIHTWERASEFVKRAGTIILAASVILWLLLNLPPGAEQEDSLFGQFSRTISPVLAPAGFGNWQSAGSLVTGFIAKEVVISTMSTIYVGGEEEEAGPADEPAPTLGGDLVEIAEGFGAATVDVGRRLVSLIPGVNLAEEKTEEESTALSAALQGAFTPLAALAFVIFVLLYVPCVATLGAMRGEFGARWAVLSGAFQIVIAWLVSTAVYQIGRLLGFA